MLHEGHGQCVSQGWFKMFTSHKQSQQDDYLCVSVYISWTTEWQEVKERVSVSKRESRWKRRRHNIVGLNDSVQCVQIISSQGEMYNDWLHLGDWSWQVVSVITFSSVCFEWSLHFFLIVPHSVWCSILLTTLCFVPVHDGGELDVVWQIRNCIWKGKRAAQWCSG